LGEKKLKIYAKMFFGVPGKMLPKSYFHSRIRV
jgi:hypothetical protein